MTAGDDSSRLWSYPEPRRFQALWFGIALLALFLGLAAALLYLVPPTDDASALSASFIPYGIVADLIACTFFGVVLVRAQRRIATALLAAVSALLLILQVIWISPSFSSDPRPSVGRSFIVISLNMRWGGADVREIRAEARHADLVVLVEATPVAFRSVRSRLASRFPYSAPGTIAQGNQSMILSRYPLSGVRPLRSTNQQWTATTAIPGVGPVAVIAAHPCNPLCGGRKWQQEHRSLLLRAEQLDAGPEIIAGDFNATDDHGPMRELAQRGFVSAADITGAGWMPTFPSNNPVVPPLIEIDHVLVNSRLTALSIRTFRVDGTDHLGLIARLARTRE